MNPYEPNGLRNFFTPFTGNAWCALFRSTLTFTRNEEHPMSSQQLKPIACRFVEKTGARMKLSLGALMGWLFLLSTFVPHSVQAMETFTNVSLQGTYAYVNNTADVASLGLITFDGSGALTVVLKVNRPDPDVSGGRTVLELSGTGTYSVEAAGTGIATLALKNTAGEVIGTFTYDFVIVQFTKKGADNVATAVSTAGKTGGIKGQLIAPTWTRRSDSEESK
jgi:hypothetical protein